MSTPAASEDPGVLLTLALKDDFRSRGLPTEVMAASFRNVDQVVSLAACDHLTIGKTGLFRGSETEAKKETAVTARAKYLCCGSDHRAKALCFELFVERLTSFRRYEAKSGGMLATQSWLKGAAWGAGAVKGDAMAVKCCKRSCAREMSWRVESPLIFVTASGRDDVDLSIEPLPSFLAPSLPKLTLFTPTK